MKKKTAAYYTLGCKLNFTETSTIEEQMLSANYDKVSFGEIADVYVINTCSVTENADKKCRNIIRQAKRKAPDSKVIVVGCYAQLKPKEISEIEGVDLVLGASEKFNLVEHLGKMEVGDYSSYIAGKIDEVDFYVNAFSKEQRTRTFLKVQDGCDYSCSFCTIPLARGKSRSATIEQVIQQANEIAKNGVKEIVLTGVNIGDFGKSSKAINQENFYQLIQALDKVEGIERFRISSIEPNLLKDEIIEFVASSKKFMPHFHIPLQSGSDTILKQMRRRYLSDLYVSRIEKIKNEIPNCCIGVDVIVGFPGETDEEFLKTVDFIKNLDVSYLHVFSYSERNNTLAANKEGVVPIQIRKQRSSILQSLSAKKKLAFYKQFVNSKQNVLWEQTHKDGNMFGFTENYIKVERTFDEKLINTITKEEIAPISASGNMQLKNQFIEELIAN